jgi:hypothetical protein
MYKLIPDNPVFGPATSVLRFNEDGTVTSIPFAPANTDYENFKTQINDESAQLEDADGVLLTPEEAKAYVATLP